MLHRAFLTGTIAGLHSVLKSLPLSNPIGLHRHSASNSLLLVYAGDRATKPGGFQLLVEASDGSIALGECDCCALQKILHSLQRSFIDPHLKSVHLRQHSPASSPHILSDHAGPWSAVPLGADLTFGFDLGPRLLGLVAMSHDHLFVVDPARAALLSVQRFNGSQFERVAKLPARLPGRSLAALHHVSPLPSNNGIYPRPLCHSVSHLILRRSRLCAP